MIYLDHASTSLPRHPAALDAALRGASWATPGRGAHDLAASSEREVERARHAVADRTCGGVVCFTSGATASLNTAILGLRRSVRAIAIDPLLHNAAYRPAVRRCARTTWRLPHRKDGTIDVSAARRDWRSETDLVVLTHASNVTGCVQPVAEITALAHEHGAIVVVDCAQTAGLLDPLELGDADIAAFSAHKALRALPGVGALVVRRNVDVEIDPLVVGGTGFDSMSTEMPRDLPGRLEAGTPNLPGIAAMCAAVTADKSPRDMWRARALGLREAVQSADVAAIGGEGDVPIVSFAIPGIDPHQVAELLERSFDIACRVGLHCAPLAHETLGSAEHGLVRVSASISTTNDELETLTSALRACRKLHPVKDDEREREGRSV